jgi:hypothetical protein
MDYRSFQANKQQINKQTNKDLCSEPLLLLLFHTHYFRHCQIVE